MIRQCSRGLWGAAFALLFITMPLLTHAEGYTNLVGIPGLTDGGTPDMEEYLNSLLRIAIIAAALIAVIKLILAGAQYVLSDLVTSKDNAKRDIRAAIVGLLIVLAAVTILRTINPELVNLSPLPPPPAVDFPDIVQNDDDDTLDEVADRYSCPPGEIAVRNSEGEVVCRSDRSSVLVTGDNMDDAAFDALPVDRDAWIDARENDPRLQQYEFGDIVGYLEIKIPESRELLAEYGYNNDQLRREFMEPLCEENGGSRVYQVERLSTRTGFYCIK